MTNKITALSDLPEDTEKFLCEPSQWGCARRVAMLIGGIATAALGFVGVSLVVSLLQHVAASGIDLHIGEHLLALLIVIIGSLMSLVIVTGVVLGYSDIAIGKEGVWLHLVASWYLLLSKRSFGKMEISEVPYTGMKRYLKPHGCSFAIHVAGLTPFHSLVGLQYGLWFTPVFLVTPDHEGYETLLKKLKELRMAYRPRV